MALVNCFFCDTLFDKWTLHWHVTTLGKLFTMFTHVTVKFGIGQRTVTLCSSSWEGNHGLTESAVRFRLIFTTGCISRTDVSSGAMYCYWTWVYLYFMCLTSIIFTNHGFKCVFYNCNLCLCGLFMTMSSVTTVLFSIKEYLVVYLLNYES